MGRLSSSLCVVLLVWISSSVALAADQPPLAKAPFDADQAKEIQERWAEHIDEPLVCTNSIGMKLTLIPPGEFMMGSTEEQMREDVESTKGSKWYVGAASGRSIELPAHRVRITKPFYMGSTEVTVGQFRQFAEASGYKTEAERGWAYGQPANRKLRTWRKTFYKQPDDHPVLQLCLRDCREFCKWLGEKEGREYHVPTEAQWEYACRAGTNTLWYFAKDNDEYEKVVGEYAWMSWDRKTTPSPVPVGQRKPNAFGLYDMHGNVWEYVADWYHEFYYKESPPNDPIGPATFNEMRDGRVMIRGGSFDWADSGARSAIRMRIRQDSNQHPHMGFRVAMRISGVKGVPPAVETRLAVREDSDTASVKTRDPVEAQRAAVTDERPKQLRIDLGGVASMEFVLIPPGTFQMGCAGGLRDERPLHKVTVSRSFYIGKYEVTQGQWEALLGEDQRLVKAKKNPRLAETVGPDNSMNGLSWNECQQFVEALRKKMPGHGFRLPTEAEWEYACRAGSRTEYYFGDDVVALDQYAKVCADDALPLRERDPLDMTVGTKKPNAWGLYDMHGSMWEWCADWYGENYYADSPVADPQGPDAGLLHVLRGGSWFRYGKYARSAYRHRAHPDATSNDFGFRVAITIPARNREASGRQVGDPPRDSPRDLMEFVRHRQRGDSVGTPCEVLADERLRGPLKTIANEFQRRTGHRVVLSFSPAATVNALVEKNESGSDAVFCMAMKADGKTSLDSLPGAKKVAWKHPSGEPVWAAVVGKHPQAAGFVRFVGGPTGHRLWSESTAGFTIVGGMSHAEAIDWVAKNRVAHTYPLTAARMLGEIGGIHDGICIDIGCGTGVLAIELAKRSNLTIIGLDIDAEMKSLFDKRVSEAGFQDRIRFVAGDAQDLLFDDDYADVIVSRGTLTFIPDIGKCLKEVDRVLKPSGVAFLGGRYLYTPHEHKITAEELRKIVAESGVAGAQVIDARGQWVKIIGPKAPQAARRSGLGPHMLANRFLADYAIVEGKCLLVCSNDGGGTQSLQQAFVELTDLEITALYLSEKVVTEAELRIAKANLKDRISCKVGKLDDNLPFQADSFDLIAGIGPVLIRGDREKKMCELYRVLRPGGAALLGGKYLGMPDFRKVSSEDLRASAAKTGISSIQVIDNMGQWVEIRKGIQDRGLRD